MIKSFAAAVFVIAGLFTARAARADHRPGCLPTDQGTITWTLPTTPVGPSWSFTTAGLEASLAAGQFQVTVWRRPCSATDSQVILTLHVLSGTPTFGIFGLFQNGSSTPLPIITVNDPAEATGNALEMISIIEVPQAISGIVGSPWVFSSFNSNDAFTLSYASSWPLYNTAVTNTLAVPAYDPSQYSLGVTPTSINLNQRGLSGSWYNPATSGQGIVMEVSPDFYSAGTGLLFAGWFTYDPSASGEQRWYTLQGQVSNSSTTATIPIYTTQGGKFNAAGTPTTNAVGQSTLTFNDCNHGVLTYTFTDGSGRGGTIPLTRLLPNTACQ